MSATWDYAEMSHVAAKFGGPNKFVNAVAHAGFVRGAAQGLAKGRMQGSVVGALVTAVLMGTGVVGAVRYQREQARLLAAEEAAKKELSDQLGLDIPKDD